MTLIRIQPEQVRATAASFRTASQESGAIISRLQGQIQALSTEWEGISKERFYNEFEQWQRAMTQFVTLLDEIGQQMNAIAERFEAVDEATL
jgi:WXG100 family type VII secretion target